MDIRNCEFCNAYVADFEVHTCRVFGNQHRQSSATLLRSCSDYIDGDIDLRTEQMPYEESIPSVNQTHSSWQHSILLNMRQKTDCEETPAAEMSSQYGAANQNLHNPKISNFLFPGTVHSEENETKSGYSLQPFEDNSVLINQTPQFCEAWNPNPDVNAPLPVAEPCFLPGFQQTFGQINERMNQISQNPNAYSEMGCSGASHSDEKSSRFVSDFKESDCTLTNRISQHCDTSLGLPISAIQNPQYNPMDPIPATDSSGTILSSKCPKEFLPKDPPDPSDRTRGCARSYACNYCDKTFPFSSILTTHVRTHTGEKPYTVCNKCCIQKPDLTKHMRVHTGEKPYKCKQCDKCFAQSSTLRRHFSSVHTEARPHKCTECGKCFAFLFHLKRHKLIHNKA